MGGLAAAVVGMFMEEKGTVAFVERRGTVRDGILHTSDVLFPSTDRPRTISFLTDKTVS